MGGVLFNPAAMDDDSEEVVAPNVAMVAQVTDPVVELPPVVLPGDLPSIQPTDVAPDIAEPVVVAPEPTPDASNDVITTETTAGRARRWGTRRPRRRRRPKSRRRCHRPRRQSPSPTRLRPPWRRTLASRRARLEHADPAVDPAMAPAQEGAAAAAVEVGGLRLSPSRRRRRRCRLRTRSWTDLDRLHVAALQETRDNARAAARLEAAVAAQGEAYVAYKARVERRGARAEHFPAPSSDLAQLLVSTYGDLLSREEATADAQGG